MRIGFLFNHDQIHQVAHSLPIAMALARGGFAGEVVVATTSARLEAEVRRLGGALIGTRIEHVPLALRGVRRVVSALAESLVPSRKLLIYGNHLDFFRSLDLLVVAEKTSLLLKTLHGLKLLKIVHTRHGAGDRAIGFDRASAGFDHVLCSGVKIRDRLIAEAKLAPEKISIVGYPKFDTLTADAPPHDPATVLYNPHCSPHLSSWFPHGTAVLDHFLATPLRPFIFAPHVMLFERRFSVTIDRLRIDRPGRIAARHRHAPHFTVDAGSRACTDMSYTQRAGLYVGDVSSQVYEFLRTPRPCLFLNSHRVAWQGDASYAHWQAGPVIEHPGQLAEGLRRAEDEHARHYRAVQERLFAQSFDLTERPSSERAAEVLVRLVERRA